MEEKDLKSTAEKIREREITGINVTLPFKQKIINQTDKIINDAKLTGSVNTILLEDDKIIGENTDVFGLQVAYLKEIDNCEKKCSYRSWRSFTLCNSLATKNWFKRISITNRTNEKCIFKKI